MSKLPPGLYRNKKSGIFGFYFYFGGKKFHKSLKTTEEAKAVAMVGMVKETIHDLERGKLDLSGGDLWQFLLSGGKRDQRLQAPENLTLGELFDLYFANLPEGAKEGNTLKTERIHRRHWERVLGARKLLAAITEGDLQAYVGERSRQKYRGKPIRRETIEKEVETLRMVWNRAYRQKRVAAKPPGVKDLDFPKGREKPPFQTWEQIEKTIARGAGPQEAADLWECLFLTLEQVAQVVEFVRLRKTRSAYFYPVVVFVAHTGARLSEVMRSRVEDFRFDDREVVLREKKRKNDRTFTFRHVPLSPLLGDVIREYWKTAHPGGKFAVAIDGDCPMLESTLHEARKAVFEGSRWQVLPGFHVFRHSFASNLALKGFPDRVIDKLLGHETQEMRRRYQHLFPDQAREAVRALFG